MSRPSRIAIVKELGSHSPRCLAAHAVRGQDEPELVVVERYPAALGADALTTLEEDTRDLVPFVHANVATLIASIKLKGDVAVMSEWVDGESLTSALAQAPSLEILLRVMTDVLEALGALHALTDSRTIGALGPDDVFLGVDGVTRITRFGLGRLAADALGPKRMTTMAPELLKGERAIRGDVFTAGTLLWTCFTGEPYATTSARHVDTSKRDAWAAPLAEPIERALALDPAERFASASEMSRAITSAVGSKIATRAMVSQYVARTFGERIESRLQKLEPKVDISLSNLPPPVSDPPPPMEAPPPAAKMPVVEVKPPVAAKPAVVNVVKPTPTVPMAQIRKAAPSTPDVARKMLPLPKAQKVLPSIAIKTNGSSAKKEPEPKIETKPEPKSEPKIIATKPEPKIEAKPETKSEAKIEAKPALIPVAEPTPSNEASKEDLDEVELVSVRPPPAPTPKQKTKTKSLRPPEALGEAPAASAAPATDDDTNVYAKRSTARGPLLILGAIVIGVGAFVAGRLTAPEPWPATPSATTTPIVSATPTQTEARPTATQTEAITTTGPSASVKPPERLRTLGGPDPSTASSSKPDASRYDPHGI